MCLFKNFIFTLALTSALNARAGIELVCKGQQATGRHQTVSVDCENRQAFVETLGAAWRELRKNSIGGSMENICWEAYKQAKGMHPSISFGNMSSSFLTRCNMGLAYVK